MRPMDVECFKEVEALRRKLEGRFMWPSPPLCWHTQLYPTVRSEATAGDNTSQLTIKHVYYPPFTKQLPGSAKTRLTAAVIARPSWRRDTPLRLDVYHTANSCLRQSLLTMLVFGLWD